jgi:hypothetical protein
MEHSAEILTVPIDGTNGNPLIVRRWPESVNHAQTLQNRMIDSQEDWPEQTELELVCMVVFVRPTQ